MTHERLTNEELDELQAAMLAHYEVQSELGSVDVTAESQKIVMALTELQAFRKAAAKPVADVVAWSSPNEERTCDIRWRRFDVAPGPLYAAPPAQVKYNIGDATMRHIFAPTCITDVSDMQAVFDRVEIVLAKSEPVAWRYRYHNGLAVSNWRYVDSVDECNSAPNYQCQSLYTAPPAQAVPTFDEWLEARGNKPLGWVKDSMREAYDACRSFMLNEVKLNQPVSETNKRG